VTRRNRGKRPGPRGRPVAPLFTTNRAAAHGGRVAYAKNSAAAHAAMAHDLLHAAEDLATGAASESTACAAIVALLLAQAAESALRATARQVATLPKGVATARRAATAAALHKAVDDMLASPKKGPR
jgi:hypothetical protein